MNTVYLWHFEKECLSEDTIQAHGNCLCIFCLHHVIIVLLTDC